MVFEELGGDVSKISLAKRSARRVCADVYENHPSVENVIGQSLSEVKMRQGANIRLSCPRGQTVMSIEFASFGTSTGTCGSFEKGTCHAPNSHAILEKVNF